jgi:hypothetical protein
MERRIESILNISRRVLVRLLQLGELNNDFIIVET